MDSVPVTSSLQIQDNFPRYGDSRDYLHTRNYNGKQLDEYISSVTDPDRPFKYQTTESSSKRPFNNDDDKKSPFTKYYADFENAYEIPDHQVPEYFRTTSSSTPTKPTKKPVAKKGQKAAPYLQDEKLKEITIVHQKALEELNEFATKIKGSETKSRPLYDFFPFFNSKPQTYQSIRTTSKTSTTKKPKNTKSNNFLPIAGSVTNHNANTRYRFENTPHATRLNQFIQSSEDDKLERAVRKALENMRRGRTSGGRGQNIGPNAKGNNVPGSGPPPFRPRRPYSSGPAPVRVFNFNN